MATNPYGPEESEIDPEARLTLISLAERLIHDRVASFHSEERLDDSTTLFICLFLLEQITDMSVEISEVETQTQHPEAPYFYELRWKDKGVSDEDMFLL